MSSVFLISDCVYFLSADIHLVISSFFTSWDIWYMFSFASFGLLLFSLMAQGSSHPQPLWLAWCLDAFDLRRRSQKVNQSLPAPSCVCVFLSCSLSVFPSCSLSLPVLFPSSHLLPPVYFTSQVGPWKPQSGKNMLLTLPPTYPAYTWLWRYSLMIKPHFRCAPVPCPRGRSTEQRICDSFNCQPPTRITWERNLNWEIV